MTEEQPARPNRKFHQGDFGEKFNDEAISVLGVCSGVYLEYLFTWRSCHVTDAYTPARTSQHRMLVDGQHHKYVGRGEVLTYLSFRTSR